MISSYIQRLMTQSDSSAKKEAPTSNKKSKSTATQKRAKMTTEKATAVQKSIMTEKTNETQEITSESNPTPQKPRAKRKTTIAAQKTTIAVNKRRRRAPNPGFELHPDFICDPCALILEDKKHYLYHMITLHALRCDCCQKRFLSKYMLQKHISAQLTVFPDGLPSVEPTSTKTKTSEVVTPTLFACSRCSETFLDKDELKQHKAEAHWKYKCTMCDQVLSTPGTLEYHMRGHMGVRPFACNQCDQRFTANTVLFKHKATCHPKPPAEPSPCSAENTTTYIIMLN